MGDSVMPVFKWDKDSVTKEARKYKTYTEFKNGSRGAFKWAVRNGVINEVTAFMYEITDPDVLMRRIEQELGSAARHAKVARDIWDSEPSPFFEVSADPESISDGTYLDFDAQMYDQGAHERSDRALDHIERLQEHGSEEQVKAAWDMYLKYQTNEWEIEGASAEIYMQGEEL